VRALVTVAPIIGSVRGLSSEVLVGPRKGVDHDSAINIDLITTIPRARLVRPIGMLLDDQEPDLGDLKSARRVTEAGEYARVANTRRTDQRRFGPTLPVPSTAPSTSPTERVSRGHGAGGGAA
jgi:hypothetical protein